MSKNSLKSIIKKGMNLARYCRLVFGRFNEMDSLDKFPQIFRSPPRIVVPGIVSPINSVPEHIIKPYYCTEDVKPPTSPIIKSSQDIETMRSTCRLARKMLYAAEKFIKVGVTTDELDKYIHNLIIKHSAYPSPLMYLGFPKSICTSVNNVACHGIPDDRKLQNGDIITVDITVFRDGFHGDCAATFFVGDVDAKAKKLVRAAKNALERAISSCRPGGFTRNIAEAVSCEADLWEYSVIPSICGHGIGKDFHECPEIIHCERYLDDAGVVMLPGMTFTIEPVLSEGEEDIIVLEDNWTATTSCNSLCAQFEHTVLITDDGVEILTR